MLTALVLLSCGGHPRAPRAAADPARTVWGLALGSTSGDALGAWAKERGLDCLREPAVRRKTARLVCATPPATALDDRIVHGRVSEILAVHTPNGPVHHVSSRRRYGIPADALADYTAAIDAIARTQGAPTRVAVPGSVDDLGGPVAWFPAVWARDDLTVELRLLRAGSKDWTVSESWSIPGVEEAVEARSIPGTAAAWARVRYLGGSRSQD